MNLKFIISKTKTFIGVLAFITGFIAIFGQDNTLIGVTAVTASLMFLQRDLTSNLGRYFILFLAVNIFQGLAAYGSNVNIYFGIPFTFISMFITGYLFTYNLKSPMFIAFGLQYLFMLYYPVNLEGLPMRLLALLACAVSIIAAQLIWNRNRFKKVSMTSIPSLASSLSDKIGKVSNGNYEKENDEDIIKNIKSIRKAVLDKRVAYFHTTLEGKINLNMTIALERTNILVDRVCSFIKSSEDLTDEDKQLLESLKDIVLGFEKCIHSDVEAEKEISLLKEFLRCYNNEYEKIGLSCISHSILGEMLETVEFMKHNLEEITGSTNKEYKSVIKKTSVPEMFKSTFVLKTNFHIRSVKFTYAFRSAVVITIGYALVKYFNIENGRWLLFTIFAITQPYMQKATTKSWYRIKGTIIGIVVFVVLFSIIKDPAIRSVIVIIAGYLNSLVERYDKQMIFITLSALGVAAVLGDTNVLAFERIALVLLGVIIALVANNFLLPYRLEDAMKDSVGTYDKIVERMKIEINLATEGKENIQSMRNLIMQTSLVEDKLYENIASETQENQKKVKTFIEEKRILVNDLYDEYLGVRSKA